MDQPIRRGTDWWHRAADGRWLRWNPLIEQWEVQTASPPPPPPPPTLRGPSAYAIASPARPGSPRRMQVLAAALVVALVVLIPLRWDALRASFDAPPPTSDGSLRTTPGVPAQEATVYDDVDSNVAACRGASAGRDHRSDPTLREFPAKTREIAGIVSSLRGHTFKRSPKFSFMTKERLAERTRQESGKHLKKARHLFGPLYLLRLIEKEDSPKSLLESSGSQVAAYYVPKEKAIFAPLDDGDLSPYEKMLLAHEIDHALVDQRIGLGVKEGFRPRKADRDAARLAVIEGDATLLMTSFLINTMDSEEQQAVGSEIASGSEGSDELPRFMQRSMAFPYSEGLLFVCRVFNRGGWEAVDNAYENPPLTTAEILFPERYFAGSQPRPVDPKDPDTPRGWTRRLVVEIGAADLMLILANHFSTPDDQAQMALPVARWNGGELHYLTKGKQQALSLTIVDSGGSGSPICGEVRSWFDGAFNDWKARSESADFRATTDGVAFLACPGDETKVVVSTDPAVGAALLGKSNMPPAIWERSKDGDIAH